MRSLLTDMERQLLLMLLTLLERGYPKGKAAVDALNLDAIQDPQAASIFRSMRDLEPKDWNPARLTASGVLSKVFVSSAEAYRFLIDVMDTPDGVRGYGGSSLMTTVRLINAEYYGKEHVLALKAASLAAEKGADPTPHIDRAELMSQKRYAEKHADTFSLSTEALDFIDGVEAGTVGQFGMDTGLMQLNNATNGFKPGQLITVGAPTGGGKSVFAMQMSLEAMAQEMRVLYVSLEMNKEELIHRMLSSISGVALDIVVCKERWTDEIKKAVLIAAHSLADSIDIIDSKRSDITMAEIRAIVAQGKYDLVVIDYLQLLSFDGPRDTSREQQVASISQAMKKMAGRYDCTVLSPVQLNEDGKARESRAVTNDSDLFLTIEPKSDGKTHQLKVKKQRMGRSGDKINVVFQSWVSRFIEESTEF